MGNNSKMAVICSHPGTQIRPSQGFISLYGKKLTFMKASGGTKFRIIK